MHPSSASYFDEGDGYVKKVVIVKKKIVQPRYDFDDGETVVVKKRFVHPGYGFYGHARPPTVSAKEYAEDGYGFHGPRRAGFYGHPGFQGHSRFYGGF